MNAKKINLKGLFKVIQIQKNSEIRKVNTSIILKMMNMKKAYNNPGQKI